MWANWLEGRRSRATAAWQLSCRHCSFWVVLSPSSLALEACWTVTHCRPFWQEKTHRNAQKSAETRKNAQKRATLHRRMQHPPFIIPPLPNHHRPQKSQRFPRQEKAMLHCDLRVRWKVASDLRFRAAISEPKTPSFLRDFLRFGSVNAEIASDCAIVRFWCAKVAGVL